MSLRRWNPIPYHLKNMPGCRSVRLKDIQERSTGEVKAQGDELRVAKATLVASEAVNTLKTAVGATVERVA